MALVKTRSLGAANQKTSARSAPPRRWKTDPEGQRPRVSLQCWPNRSGDLAHHDGGPHRALGLFVYTARGLGPSTVCFRAGLSSGPTCSSPSPG